jgi:lipopolysaccharide/colanic/teichoic acid biosynthesis glycosyltransferase
VYRRFGKRTVDIALSALLLILLAPVIGIVAAIVRRRLGSPVLFRQQRPGLREQPFTMFKFRTMTEAADVTGKPLPDAARLTRLGQVLRSTSLDELPELWNVFRGEMSFVGPRPLLVDYLPRYSSSQRRRHDVKPGITGLAQVSGRNDLTWDEKLGLDVRYAGRVTFAGDLLILLKTIACVLRREGIARDGHATAPEFLGPGR